MDELDRRIAENLEHRDYVERLNSKWRTPPPSGLPGTSASDLGLQDTTKEGDGWSTDYYKLPTGAKELADLIDHKDMNFNVGNIFKAAYRLGDKHGVSERYDLNKIIWFAKRELSRIGEL